LTWINPRERARLIMVAGGFMPNRLWLPLVAGALAILAGCGSFLGSESQERTSADVMRGSELYRMHCSACHTAQVHWRDARLARSWDDLRYQVARWQRMGGQSWSREEIEDVAAYLNRVFYELPCPLPGCGGPKADIPGPATARIR
jgi:mono/diheme cytochrome c family protein